MGPQLGQHPGRMSQPHRPLAVGQQPLEDIVDRQVARRRPGPSRRGGRRGESARPRPWSCRCRAGRGSRPRRGNSGRTAPPRAAPRSSAGFNAASSGSAFTAGPRRPRSTSRSWARRSTAGGAGAIQRDPLPLGRGLVVRQVESPGGVIGQVVGMMGQRDADGVFVPVEHHAAEPFARLGAVGREQHGRAHAQTRPGERSAFTFDELDQVAPAQSGVFVGDDQVEEAVAALLGRGGGELAAALEHPLGFRGALQLEQPGQPGEMFFVGRGMRRRAMRKPRPPRRGRGDRGTPRRRGP